MGAGPLNPPDVGDDTADSKRHLRFGESLFNPCQRRLVGQQETQWYDYANHMTPVILARFASISAIGCFSVLRISTPRVRPNMPLFIVCRTKTR